MEKIPLFCLSLAIDNAYLLTLARDRTYLTPRSTPKKLKGSFIFRGTGFAQHSERHLDRSRDYTAVEPFRGTSIEQQTPAIPYLRLHKLEEFNLANLGHPRDHLHEPQTKRRAFPSRLGIVALENIVRVLDPLLFHQLSLVDDMQIGFIAGEFISIASSPCDASAKISIGKSRKTATNDP
jgi:hypothetical protein